MNDILQKLYDVIAEKKSGNPEKSYTASLFQKGIGKITQKVGEEAIETCIESVSGNKEKIKSESADLLYHLLVLWAYHDIRPDDVMQVLTSREGISGIDEKNSRKD